MERDGNVGGGMWGARGMGCGRGEEEENLPAAGVGWGPCDAPTAALLVLTRVEV